MILKKSGLDCNGRNSVIVKLITWCLLKIYYFRMFYAIIVPFFCFISFLNESKSFFKRVLKGWQDDDFLNFVASCFVMIKSIQLLSCRPLDKIYSISPRAPNLTLASRSKMKTAAVTIDNEPHVTIRSILYSTKRGDFKKIFD